MQCSHGVQRELNTTLHSSTKSSMAKISYLEIEYKTERKKMVWKHWTFQIEMVGVFATWVSQNMDVPWTKETPHPFKYLRQSSSVFKNENNITAYIYYEEPTKGK